MTNNLIYRIGFHNQGKVYEIYAERVINSELFGFVEVESLLFGETSSVVVDPSEERLKNEFDGVSRFLVPLHAVSRIDVVEKRGTPKIKEVSAQEAKVMPFPASIYPPPTIGNK